MNARTPPLAALPMASDRALPPKTGLEEYEIERVLAQSSFSIVYRAYDHVLKLHVAIKEYLPDALAVRGGETQVVLRNRAHAERFQLGAQAFVGEAQTLARCDHPSLVRVLRIVQRHGTYYRVMRYSPGPTLLAFRRETGVAPGAAALRAWLDGLLGALETLHDEGCVHGAVAPGNVLLLPGDKPVLLDFDAVRGALISDRTQNMMAALEPSFAPPERQAPDDDAVDGPCTDLYSLAATLHYAIGGQLPPPPAGLASAAPVEAFGALWRRLAAGQPGLGEPPAWLGALDACLSDEPSRRPQTVAALRGLLAVAAADTPRRPRAPRAAPRTLSELKLVPAGSGQPPAASAAVAAAPLSALHEAAVERSAERADESPGERALPPGVDLASPRPAEPPVPAPPAGAGASFASPASAAPQAAAAAAPAMRSAASTPQARVIADLDETFAFIARQASEEAAAPKAPAAEPQAPAAEGTVPAGSLLITLLATRRGRWVLGGLLVLLVIAAVAALVGQLLEARSGLPAATAAAESSPAPAAPGGPGALPALPPLPQAPTAAGPPPAAKEPAAAAPPPAAKAAGVPPSPRARCGQRSGYALFECMKEQCAKRAYRQHEQCVRLRKEQRLSRQTPAGRDGGRPLAAEPPRPALVAGFSLRSGR